MNIRRFAVLLILSGVEALFAQSPTTFRYLYDDAGQLYRVLDSTGTLIEYTYDPSGNITKVSRSTVASGALSILNVTPSNAIGGKTITIAGQNFSAVIAGDTVMIGGVTATVLSASLTQLVVLVPGGTVGGAVSVTVGGVTATWSNTINVVQPPLISSISPASGKKGTTITVAVAGQYLFGATFALQSVDPSDTSAGAAVTVVSNTGTLATLTLVLGATEGQFALVGTNSVGVSAITPASLFLIGPTTSSVSFYASVLNTSDNPTTNPTLPAGQNFASFYASVLNTSYNPTTNPTLPAGQNSASFYASVLNTSYNPTTNPQLPAGQNSASYFISVCNTDSGCTATSPAIVSANASPASTRPRPAAPLQAPSSRDSLPVLEPLEEITSVTVGQTIRLGARNADPGSIVEFDVNRATIGTVGEAPYETLFTVPDGPADLVFQIVVRAPGQPERLSQVTRMTVIPDSGANILGSIAQGTAGLELSLAAGGLRAEFFHLAQPVLALPSLDGAEPVRAGYVTAINEPNPGALFGDDPLGAHLSPDYAIRFSGEVRADQPGKYRFWLAALSGAAILIDGKPLADSGFVSGEPSQAAGSLALDRGWHFIEVIYYLGVGASSVRLDWQPPNSGRREVLGPEYLRTVLAGMTTVSAADGSFSFAQVPRKFDTVWIRVKQGDGFLEFPAVKAGAGPVSIAVPK